MNKYIVGLDGGGTKTAVTVADLRENILLTFQSGAINPNGEKIENVNRNLADIFAKLKEVCGSMDNCAAVCIGSAGISNPTVEQVFVTAAEKAEYRGKLVITGDHQTAFYGALGKPLGAILIAGTGSICYGKNKFGREHRTGGFGHLIDDEGSGYAIGRDILSSVVRAFDGREEKTVLTDMVYHQLHCSNIEQLVGFIYDTGTNKRDIAALSPNLTLACAQKDKAALRIAEKCAEELKNLAVPVVEKLELQKESLALSGSILLKDDTIKNGFINKIKADYPDLTCHMPKHDASYGAVLIAMESLSAE